MGTTAIPAPCRAPSPEQPPAQGRGEVLPWHTQPSNHAPSPPAQFTDDQGSPPAGTFPYTPSMVLCSVQIPDPARSRHGGCIYPLSSPDSPHSQSPLGAPLPSEGARARVPGLGGLSSGPAAPARLPGCGRCLLRLCPEPRHRSRRGAQPPRGSGAFQWHGSLPGHRSLPGVPEPPGDTGGAELPGCGATQRYRSRRGAGAAGYRPTAVPWPPGPVSVPLFSSVPPRPVPLPPAPPGRHRGARPGGLRAPRPAAGERGPGLRLKKDPGSPPPFNPYCSGGSGLTHPTSLQVSPAPRPKYLLLQALSGPHSSPHNNAVSRIPGLCSPASPSTYVRSSALSRPLSSTHSSIPAFRGAAGGVSHFWSVGDQPSPAPGTDAPAADSVPLRTQPYPCVFPQGSGLPASHKAGLTSLSPCHRDHLCCRERLLCSRIYRWSKQDPKMRVR